MLALCAVVLLAGDFYHPHAQPPVGPKTLDMAVARPRVPRTAAQAGLRFDALDSVMREGPLAVPTARVGASTALPPEWTQVGDGVVPTPVADGWQVDPVPLGAFEDIPGNKYPRKHTLYLNFVGANLVPTSNDISAEDRSALAGDAPFPACARARASTRARSSSRTTARGATRAMRSRTMAALAGASWEVPTT